MQRLQRATCSCLLNLKKTLWAEGANGPVELCFIKIGPRERFLVIYAPNGRGRLKLGGLRPPVGSNSPVELGIFKIGTRERFLAINAPRGRGRLKFRGLPPPLPRMGQRCRGSLNF